MKLDGIFVLTVPGSDLTCAATLSTATATPLVTLPGERLANPSPEIARKRNLALETARHQHWRYILLLDDDITIHPAQIPAALKLLHDYPAAGFRVTDYPDHSTLIHAHLAAGGTSPVCISGAALLLDMLYPHPRFPPVYNEDQLFLHPLLCTGRVADAGEARQRPYDPFTLTRATTQEFGDLLADGFNRLTRTHDTPGEKFWQDQISLRHAFAAKIMNQLTPGPARQAVQASLTELGRITPGNLMRFAVKWILRRGTCGCSMEEKQDPSP